MPTPARRARARRPPPGGAGGPAGQHRPAAAALERAHQAPREFIARHVTGDWGEVPEEDKTENEVSLLNGTRILSAYRTRLGERLWILTEADRSVTTILLPEEY